MSNPYRTYDCSSNLILNPKINAYKPYKSLKDRNIHDAPEPLQAKIFDRQQKNQRILSRNDRIDLFLEGGNFSEPRQTFNKGRFDPNICRISYDRKQESFIPFKTQTRTRGWHTANYMNHNSQMVKPDYICFIYTAGKPREKPVEESKLITAKTVMKQMKQPKRSFNLIEPRRESPKKLDRLSLVREKTQESPLKEDDQKNSKNMHEKSINNKNTSNSENLLKKVNKIERPMFYLDPKDYAHIRAQSFMVTEYPSGQIIFGQFYKKTGEIASLTKIMTFYTVYQIAAKYSRNVSQEQVQIDEEAQFITGTSAEIFVGDIYTIEQLFYGLMLPSGNDAATALAKWGGSILQQNDSTLKPESKGTQVKTFIRYMNLLAKKCGMKNSNFCNPHGLPHPQSCSNPEDLSCLMFECLKIDLFRQIIKTKRYTCWVEHEGVKHQVIWENTNKLLRRPNFIGGKTGVTVTAGPCLVSCYQCLDRIFIVVLLRTNKLSRRFKDTRYLVGLALTKLDKTMYKDQIKKVLKNDPELDSDNSDDQQQFNYERNDIKQMTKRNKILTFEM